MVKIKKQPVVVLVGHIDHGKSSILEAIWDFKITEKEAGGITQHIGAYEIEQEGQRITFLDTPGHEAFSTMRERGAKVADIAILVVAADEGVKPQTKEAILHLKKAGVPIIVALNKMDKTGANPYLVQQQLAKEGIVVEELGGEVPCVKVSAKTGEGIKDLVEMIVLVAEMLDLEIEKDIPAKGVVIEASLDPKRGPLATLLIEQGRLREGDVIWSYKSVAKARRIEDFRGEKVKEVLPGQAVQVLGWDSVPVIGETFEVLDSLQEARKRVDDVLEKEKEEKAKRRVISEEDERKKVHLILKADTEGTLEALERMISGLPQDKVFIKIVHREVGPPTLEDIQLAESTGAKIICFRVKPSSKVKQLLEQKNIPWLFSEVIYELVENTRRLLERELEPQKVRIEKGELEVLVVFKSQGTRQIIGCRVVEGEVAQGDRLELFRNEEFKGKGKVVSLQMNKREIEKGQRGDEVGILWEGNVKVREGDKIKVIEERVEKVVL